MGNPKDRFSRGEAHIASRPGLEILVSSASDKGSDQPAHTQTNTKSFTA